MAEKMERWYNVENYFSNNELYQYLFKEFFLIKTIEEAIERISNDRQNSNTK